MEKVDHIDNINDLIIEINAQLLKTGMSKELLIRECFALWYALLEGVECENFSENDLNKLLVDNFKIFQENFSDDVEYSFIIGWMLSVAFWYFRSTLDENDGRRLLMNVYNQKKENCLFKWAVKDQLKLDQREINELYRIICARFDTFYNYGPLIRNYFLEIVKS